MGISVTDNEDEMVVYEISGTLPERELPPYNTSLSKKAYIAFMTVLFGSIFVAACGILLYFLVVSIT